LFEAPLSGFALGGGLIVAIGAQNAFVLRQGVLGQHVFALCLFCAVSDALLIVAGTLGIGTLIEAMPRFITIMTWGGAAFLAAYGLLALKRAFEGGSLAAAREGAGTLRAALAACAAFTFLNPHVYLDTVILVGSMANARPSDERWPFAAGAVLASFTWFFSLGYGARALAPWLARPAVWRGIDLLIAMVMFALAAMLLLG
jgi:L-lysine exporter family protein LysE/ArgO